MLRPGPFQLGLESAVLTVTLSMEGDKDVDARKGTWLFRIAWLEAQAKRSGPL